MSKLIHHTDCSVPLNYALVSVLPFVPLVAPILLSYGGVAPFPYLEIFSIVAGGVVSLNGYQYGGLDQTNREIEAVKSSALMAIKFQYSFSAIKLSIDILKVLKSGWEGELNIRDNIDWYNAAEFVSWSLLRMNPVDSLQVVFNRAIEIISMGKDQKNIIDVIPNNKLVGDYVYQDTPELVPASPLPERLSPTYFVELLGKDGYGYGYGWGQFVSIDRQDSPDFDTIFCR
ncbi:hypothetical protein SZ25_00040 [Candidatus Arcanobacter lacustris]|uniref:Uncharacterized protein n=1 Tax=Candidatus Arcanibacter lacustris TaxID=1607817 RepID=A0A0F5MQA0_9RICK|nr:hypothetical protein SZ25_00040 [Candidatus Arcanobacter lacustris]